MKFEMKIKLLTLLLAVGSLAMAQSLTIERVDVSKCYEPNVNISSELVAYLDVKNNSSSSIDVLVKRIDKNYNGLTDSNAICWGGQCWPASISVSPFPATLTAGQTSSPADFSAHVYPNGDGVAYKGDITYVFYDANNPSDSVAYTVTYQLGQPIGIEENVFKNFAVYPNPTSNVLNIQYNGMSGEDVSFELVNMVGNKVYSRNLSEVDANLRLDVSNLARGVYFYVIKADGVITSSKKLIIK